MNVSPKQSKQKPSSEIRADAIQASHGWKKRFKQTEEMIEDIKARDKKTRRFKEPIINAQQIGEFYGGDGKRNDSKYTSDYIPWTGDLNKMTKGFEQYISNPKTNIVYEHERQNVISNIATVQDWYDHMTETQWAVETQAGGPTRDFWYEQQQMDILKQQKDTIESTPYTDEYI